MFAAEGMTIWLLTGGSLVAILYVLRGDRRHAEAAAKILRGFTNIMPKYSVAPLKGIVTYATLEECDWAINAASACAGVPPGGTMATA